MNPLLWIIADELHVFFCHLVPFRGRKKLELRPFWGLQPPPPTSIRCFFPEEFWFSLRTYTQSHRYSNFTISSGEHGPEDPSLTNSFAFGFSSLTWANNALHGPCLGVWNRRTSPTFQLFTFGLALPWGASLRRRSLLPSDNLGVGFVKTCTFWRQLLFIVCLLVFPVWTIGVAPVAADADSSDYPLCRPSDLKENLIGCFCSQKILCLLSRVTRVVHSSDSDAREHNRS